jgi:hypothetical protein
MGQPYKISNNPYFMTKPQTPEFHKELILSALKQGKYVVVLDTIDDTYTILSPLNADGDTGEFQCTRWFDSIEKCFESNDWDNNIDLDSGQNHFTFHSIYTPQFEKPELKEGDWVRIDMDEREIPKIWDDGAKAMINSGKAYQIKDDWMSFRLACGIHTQDKTDCWDFYSRDLTKLTPEQAKYLNSPPDQKTKETITIGGVEYDKQEVEDRLKDIKPVKKDIYL